MNCLPKYYDHLEPYFNLAIDYSKIELATAKSRTMENVVGLFWSFEGKNCRIFISIDDNEIHENYSKYVTLLLLFLAKYHEEQELSRIEQQLLDENEPEVLSVDSNANEFDAANDLPNEIIRVSDASGIYHDVILRSNSKQNRRQDRPLAIVSDMFKCTQEKQMTNANDKVEKPKRKPFWKIFRKLNRKKSRARSQSPLIQFQQPCKDDFMLNISDAVAHNDLEWYDLNRSEMNNVEAKSSAVLHQFNGSLVNNRDTNIENIQNLELTQRLTVSSNILWSHNLSISCESISDDVSNVNLLGANLNRDQVYSDVYIEEDGSEPDLDILQRKLNYSVLSTDSNGYAIMRPIIDHNNVGKIQTESNVEEITLDNSFDDSFDDSFDFDDYDNEMSSGFGSNSGIFPEPDKALTTPSLATSEYGDYAQSPALETAPASTAETNQTEAKTMQTFNSVEDINFDLNRHLLRGTPFRVNISSKLQIVCEFNVDEDNVLTKKVMFYPNRENTDEDLQLDSLQTKSLQKDETEIAPQSSIKASKTSLVKKIKKKFLGFRRKFEFGIPMCV